MGKRAVVIMIIWTLCVSPLAVSAGAAGNVTIVVDGKKLTEAAAYTENGTAYVPIRDVAERLGAPVVIWDGCTRTAVIEAPGLRIEAQDGDKYLTANGRYLFIPRGVTVKNGRTMVPARVLAAAYGAKVEWIGVSRTVTITSGTGPIASGDEYYSRDDVYWLSRIIEAEAGSESLEGKIAVGNVVMNRVGDSEFPNTVKGVIFDKRYSVQFTPAYSGAIYNEPCEESLIAAKLVLDGANTAGNCLYFASADIASTCWAAKNRELYAVIDNQAFYV